MRTNCKLLFPFAVAFKSYFLLPIYNMYFWQKSPRFPFISVQKKCFRCSTEKKCWFGATQGLRLGSIYKCDLTHIFNLRGRSDWRTFAASCRRFASFAPSICVFALTLYVNDCAKRLIRIWREKSDIFYDKMLILRCTGHWIYLSHFRVVCMYVLYMRRHVFLQMTLKLFYSSCPHLLFFSILRASLAFSDNLLKWKNWHKLL